MKPHNTSLPHPVNMVTLKMVREKRLGYGKAITRSEDVIALVQRLYQNSYREMVVVIGLDHGNVPTMAHIVSLGNPSESALSISCIFKPLLLSNSSGYILVHNHPANNLQPSSSDKELTEKLKSIGQQFEITMLDHIILNADGSDFYSFKTEGTM
jgi:DNA repair protein RadC